MADIGHSVERIEAAERRWGLIVIAIGLGMLLFTISTTLIFAVHPPSHVERVDADRLHVSGEFVEANLGTEMAEGGRAIVRIVARQFNFDPGCITVPAGAKVTFRMTSADAIHGMFVPTTNINTMIVPGYVSELTTSFDKPGVYRFPCHEFCGLGHQDMWAEIRVLTASEWATADKKRARCD